MIAFGAGVVCGLGLRWAVQLAAGAWWFYRRGDRLAIETLERRQMWTRGRD